MNKIGVSRKNLEIRLELMCVTDDIAYYLYRELEKAGKTCR